MDDICGNMSIAIGNASIPWVDLARKGIRQSPGTSPSYLRPDLQSIMPWIYTLIILIVHIPTVLIRVMKWENVQLWCLACTTLTIVVYTQAYISTKFEPEKILVWTPILLLIDAGSMAQIFFLLSHDKYLLTRVRHRWIEAK